MEETADPTQLKPMDLGDILDTIFRLYRNNFLTFIGIVALVQIPFLIVQIGITMAFNQTLTTDLTQIFKLIETFDAQHHPFSDLPIGSLLSFMGVIIIFSFLQGFIGQHIINGALINAISKRYHAQPVTMMSAYGYGINRMVSLIVTGLLIGIIMGIISAFFVGIIIASFVFMMSVGSSQGSGEGAFLMIVAVLMLIVAFILMALILGALSIIFLFFSQAIVLEGCGPLESLRRSLRLVRGSFWRIIGITILITIMVQIITVIPSAVMGGAIGAIFNDPIRDFAIRESLTTLIGYIAQIFVMPLLLLGYTLLYYDLRVRKEGYDLSQRISTDGIEL